MSPHRWTKARHPVATHPAGEERGNCATARDAIHGLPHGNLLVLQISFSDFGSRNDRSLENPLQNRVELLVPFMPAIEPETILIQVRLQVFWRHGMIDPANPSFH